MSESSEAPFVPELAKESPPVKIILQRHGETDRTQPKIGDSVEIKNKAGWLTDNGVRETEAVAREKASQVISEAVASGHPVSFFFLNSSAPWYGEGGVAYGKRAEQTAQIDARVVQEVASELGLSTDQVRIHQFGKSVEGTRAHPKLHEPNWYHVDGSENPRAYHQAVVEKYGPTSAEEGYLNIDPDLEEQRKLAGAKSAAEEGQEILDLVRVIDRYSAGYKRTYPEDIQVYWGTSHGDKERAFLQYGLGVGDNAKGYTFSTAEILEIELDKGKLSTTFNNQDYTIELNQDKPSGN